MFKKLTKFIVNEMDPGEELVPVESIAHNEHFRPLCLLIKKRKPKRIFHPDPYYQHSRFTLQDVLLPGKDTKMTEPILEVSSQFTLTQTSADQADGDVNISVDHASVGLQGAASLSNVFSIKLQKKSMSLQSLEELRRERNVNMDHSFIQQLRRTDTDLYVVTETLEASEEAEYKECSKTGGGFMARLYAALFAKVTRENNQGIVIPKGCTLAFRTTQLHIRDGAWYLGHIPMEVMVIRSLQALSGKQIVEKEVEYSCRIFSELSPDLLLTILNAIKAVMRDKNLLQELSQKMEEVAEQNGGYELKTDSPDLQALFSTLQHSPRDRLLQLAEGITYVLDALHELLEDQLLLLLESLERKIVSQQLKLVSTLLECGVDKGNESFHVDAELLSFPHEEEQMLTIALVELSGVQLQEDESAVPRDQPFEAVAALFVALYTLNLLSGSK
ncbi:gasdermin-A3-like isoform X2 [Sylvia atricapilla]|uniref:gasdermin-A3-like isoform X2 n=1 Tax=Sylvia atricapilla TaxID=48155 RepID=UPI003391CB9E